MAVSEFNGNSDRNLSMDSNVPRLVCLSLAVLCWHPSGSFAEERFGLIAIVDGTLSRASLPSLSYSGPSDSQTNASGQGILLGSFRLKQNLALFYEGRMSHVEELSDSPTRFRQTYTNSVVQGYLRYSTGLPSGLNVQVGKFGHPFGQFLTRNYPDQNPLIDSPLIYSHRTTIHSDRVPSAPHELIRNQSSGSSAEYYGTGSGGGLPLTNFSYPTGVMAYGNTASLDYRFALINSSLANPLNLGNPGQRLQWVIGGGLTCFQSLRLGASYTEGPYLNGKVQMALPAGTTVDDFSQKALGLDLQYTFRHLEVQGELLFNNFRVPNIYQRLGATGYFLEFKQTLTPRLYFAMRWNQIYFDRFRDYYGSDFHPRFDNNVNSLELGIGFHISEKLLAKTSYQYRRTLETQSRTDDFFGLQLVYRFDARKLFRSR